MKTILNQTSLALARGIAKLTRRTATANDRLWNMLNVMLIRACSLMLPEEQICKQGYK
ncbi:MAG: hypothetical protein LBF43_00295 [Puniceicoccales bacterium]|nr:hypothetical protein [Puniceicoccales bacterium]